MLCQWRSYVWYLWELPDLTWLDLHRTDTTVVGWVGTGNYKARGGNAPMYWTTEQRSYTVLHLLLSLNSWYPVSLTRVVSCLAGTLWIVSVPVILWDTISSGSTDSQTNIDLDLWLLDLQTVRRIQPVVRNQLALTVPFTIEYNEQLRHKHLRTFVLCWVYCFKHSRRRTERYVYF